MGPRTVRAAALRYLALRARTTSETRDKLRRLGSPAETVETVLRDFERLGYLDDRQVALAWGRSRAVRKRLGRRVLEMELARRGVAREIVREVVREIYLELDEASLAREALAAHRRRGRASAARALLRKGHAIETVRKLIMEVPR